MPPPEQPPPVDSANDDESVRVDIAVRALGDMRSRAAIATTSSSGDRQTSTSRNNVGQDASQQQQQQPSGSDFVSRMSSFPLVGSALRAYEHGKASSRALKYGAEMVESSVKAVSKPVIDRLPVNQLDEFACRQLDRLDKYRRPSTGPEPTSPRSPASSISAHAPTSRRLSNTNDTSLTDSPERGRPKLRTKTLDGTVAPENDDHEYDRYRRNEHDISMERPYEGSDRSVPQWIQATHSCAQASSSGTRSPTEYSRPSSPPLRVDRRSRSPAKQYPSEHPQHDHSSPLRGEPRDPLQSQGSNQDPERQVVQRSRWQAMLLEAGGLGVALSEENMRRLKYCLQWLQCATAHIDAQIIILRDFIESIQPIPHPNASSHRRPPISEEHLRKLTEVRKDIVLTVRQMVDVVSKYAGGALPEPARGKVRGFILNLPQRWATRAAATNGPPGAVPVPTAIASGATSERERETVAAAGSSTGIHRRGQGKDRRAANRERGTGSRAASPSPLDLQPHPHPHPHLHHSSQPPTDAPAPSGNQKISHSTATAAAQRILTLATESLDMMRNVTGVVSDSLDRADAWVNRLRVVGVQRTGQDNIDETTFGEDYGPTPRESPRDPGQRRRSRDTYRTLTHRRGESGSSGLGEDETSFSGSIPASPFTTNTTLSLASGYQSNSSYTAASSMPSTPTGVAFVSPPISNSTSARDVFGGAVASAPSPGAIPLASMHIASRYNTPKLTASGLPLEEDSLVDEEEAEDLAAPRKGGIARMDVDSS